jgi:TIR domain
MLKTFISYNRGDRNFAIELEKILISAGIEVWRDEKDLQIGDSIIDTISEAINSSDYIIAILSSNSVNSWWVQKELLWAMIKEQEFGQTLLLPIVIGECEIPYFLKDRYFIQFNVTSGQVDTESADFVKSTEKLLDKFFVSDFEGICAYCKFHLPMGVEVVAHLPQTFAR